MSKNILQFLNAGEDVHYQLVELVQAQTYKIDILYIDTTAIDIYDVTLFNEFYMETSVEELQLLHLSADKGLTPAITQVSVFYEMKRLVLNCKFSVETLKRLLTPSLESLWIFGHDITVELLGALYGHALRDLDFTSSNLVSVAALMRAVPTCESIVLQYATLLDILMLFAQCTSVHVRAARYGDFNETDIKRLRNPVSGYVDGHLRAHGVKGYLESYRLRTQYGVLLADYAFKATSPVVAADAFELRDGSSVVLVFIQQDNIYKQWVNIAAAKGPATLKRLLVFPDKQEKDYETFLSTLKHFVNYATLDEFGVGITSEEIRNWVYSAAGYIHFVLRSEDKRYKMPYQVRLISNDEFLHEKLEPYVFRRNPLI